MAVHVPGADLPRVLEVLKSQLPHSISVYTAVQLITQGLTGYDVFVDQWPDINAVIVIPSMEALSSSTHEKCTFLFCPQENFLRNILVSSGALEMPIVSLAYVQRTTFDKICEILLKTKEPTFVEQVVARPMTYYTTTRVGQAPLLPEGFSQRRLSPSDATTVTDVLGYKKYDYCKSVRRVLEIGTLSNVGVVDTNGQLVAWSLQHISGFLGMTHVKPQYRGKGLGKYVTVVLAQTVIDRDGFCMLGIERENHISINLHESIGFTRMEIPYYSGTYLRKDSNCLSMKVSATSD